jgi:undecaprenyl-diphosphatase
MHETELTWIHSLQDALRSPGMDLFFVGWNFVDTLPFYLLLIAAVWYLIGKRIGAKLFYIMMLGAVINHTLKYLFDWPRPCQTDPSVGLICSTTPGFPSGAAQTAILLAGIIFIESLKKSYRVLGVLFALIFCFSRIYLGQHYITDVIGGMVVGAALLWVYWKLFPQFIPYWKAAIFVFPVLLILLSWGQGLELAVVSFGAGIGLSACRQEIKGIVPLGCAIAGMGALYVAMLYYPPLTLLFAFASGIWLTALPCVRRRC